MMITNILQTDQKHEMRADSSEIYVTSLQEVAETICNNALDQARAKINPSLTELGLDELLRHHNFFAYFKFGLTNGVANALAANDEWVQSIYYFDPSINPDAETEEYLPQDASVNLLVLVKNQSAALTSFIASLDRALTQQVAALPAPSLVRLSSILNALLITEADVAERRGYAALLSSMFSKPRQIWSR